MSEVRRAHSWIVVSCGHCPNAHVALKDEQGVIFADFTVGPGQEKLLAEGCAKAHRAAREEQIKKQNNGGRYE